MIYALAICEREQKAKRAKKSKLRVNKRKEWRENKEDEVAGRKISARLRRQSRRAGGMVSAKEKKARVGQRVHKVSCLAEREGEKEESRNIRGASTKLRASARVTLP